MPGSPSGGLGGGTFLGSSATVAPGPPPDFGGTGVAGLTGDPFDSTLFRVPPVGVEVGILSVSNGLPVRMSTSRSTGANAPASPAVRSTPIIVQGTLIGHLRGARPEGPPVGRALWRLLGSG